MKNIAVYSKAIAGALGSAAGAVAAFNLPADTPAWASMLLTVVVTVLSVYFAPRNADPVPPSTPVV